jgi:hypothetical protein
MTSRTNSRIAGTIFLAYIATGLTTVAVSASLRDAAPADTLAAIAANPGTMRLIAFLSLLTGFEAIILGAALYALTRHQDRDLAVIAFACRIAEGVVNAMAAETGLTLLSAARASVVASESSVALGAFAFGGSITVSATLFAGGSTIFAWLFLRAGSIPRWMAQLGVAASLLLVVLLPMQMLGVVRGMVANVMWLPMLVFELAIAGWLIVRGVAEPWQPPSTSQVAGV